MNSLAELFSQSNFQRTIRDYCSEFEWKITDINDHRAILKFDTDTGRTQTLYIIKYESTLEFSVPSELKFDETDDIPHYLSTVLLKRSSGRKIGFWCLEEIGEKQVYSHMHNAEIELIDVDYFGKVVRALVNECDHLEESLANLLSHNRI